MDVQEHGMDDLLFAVGQCRGQDWILVHSNAAFDRLLLQRGGDLQNKELLGMKDPPLGKIMAAAGLEQVYAALSKAAENVPCLFHCRDCLYILEWKYLERPTAARGNNAPDRIFVMHALPLRFPEAMGLTGWREINALFDSLHDGIWVIDADGVTLRVNKALERMTGIPANELEGRHVSVPMRQGRYQASMTLRALEEKRPVTMLDYYENGKRFLNTSTPVFDDAGNIWRVVACIRDMTELEQLQDRLVGLEIDNRKHKGRLGGQDMSGTANLVGASAALRRLTREISKAAQSDAIAMILGETGTGKTLAAQTIHAMGLRRKEPFVAVNCGALPETLIESELFGYEKGAFTGAKTTGKVGLFESAGNGTIFLDEIAELSPMLQAKLLHVLDGHSFTRVGGVRPVSLKARIIAATNRPLEELVTAGAFREDLYYRINVLTVRIPPLKERLEDIPALSRYFLAEANRKNGMNKVLKPEVLRHFASYSWPGNVRELRATIEYLVAMSEQNTIGLEDLPDKLRERPENGAPREEDMDLKAVLALKERELIAKALEETGSTWKAAKRLKISQASVVRKAKRYSIGVNAVVHNG